MYKIYYYAKEFYLEENEDGEKVVNERIIAKEYECLDKEFESWLKTIKECYGQYGDVAYQYLGVDKVPKEDTFTKSINSLIYDSIKKDVLIKTLTNQVNKLTLEVVQLKGGTGNV